MLQIEVIIACSQLMTQNLRQNGGDDTDWVRARLQTRTTWVTPHRRTSREAGCEKWSTGISYLPSCNSMHNM